MYQDKEERPRTAGASLLFPGAFPLQGERPCVGLIPPCFCADCEAIRTKAGGRAQPAKISPGRAGAARSRAKAWPGGQRQAPPGGGRGHYRPAPSQGCPRTAPRCAKRSFGEAPLLRYNARLACLHLQRDAGGRPGWRGIQLPARGDGISCPRQAQALWPAGSQAEPGTGPLRQAAAVSQAARARAAKLPEARPPVRPASAVESTEPPDSKRAAPATGPPSCSAVLRSED